MRMTSVWIALWATCVIGLAAEFSHAGETQKEEKANDLLDRIRLLQKEITDLNQLARASGPAAREPAGTTRPAVHPYYNVDYFTPVPARFVRFQILATRDGAQPCLDELEIYGPGSQTNLARTKGAKATASSALPGHEIHKVHHLNDGKYGNAWSWISDEMGKGWVQIELPAATKVNRLVWSRDFGPEPRYRDRLPVKYRIEVSTDGKAWQTVSTDEGRDATPRDEHDPTLTASLDPAARKKYDELTTALAKLQKGEGINADARYQHALKELMKVSPAWGGPANDPKRIEFIAMGGVFAQFPLHDGACKELRRPPHLQRLSLAYSGVTDVGLKEIKDIQSISELDLESTRVTDAGVRPLKNMKGLRTLNLAGTQVTDAVVKDLCELPHLSSLNLRGTRVSADGIKGLANAKELRHLLYFPVTDRLLKNLDEIGKLHVLHQVGARDANRESITSLNLASTQATAACVKELKLTNLRTLSLASTPTSDASLESVKDLSDLTQLDLSNTPVSGAGMKYLKNLRHLRTLKLSNTQVDGAGLKELAELPELQLLYLGNCPLVDDDLKILGQMKSLKELSFQKSKLTDAGMKYLKDCKNLNVLLISQLDITDAGLRELSGLPELNLLLLGVTKVTPQGFSAFKDAKNLKTLVIFGGAFKNNSSRQELEQVRGILPGVEVRSWLGKR